MQRYSIRHVSRAVFAGILIAGLAAGAGCQKKSETDTGAGATSDASAVGGMSPAPSTAPSGTPSSARRAPTAARPAPRAGRPACRARRRGRRARAAADRGSRGGAGRHVQHRPRCAAAMADSCGTRALGRTAALRMCERFARTVVAIPGADGARRPADRSRRLTTTAAHPDRAERFRTRRCDAER